jgi:hypothetical protein
MYGLIPSQDNMEKGKESEKNVL